MEGLAPWLWQLLSKNRAVGVDAARHLEYLRTDAFMRTVNEGNVPTSHSGTWGEYGVEVRAAVSAPDFPTRNFLLALLEFMELAQEKRMQLFREEQARQNVRADAIIARLPAEPSEAERQKARRLLVKVAESSNTPSNSNEELQNQWLQRQIEADCIFGCLGAELLVVSDKLRRWANTGERQRQVAEALERMGVTAKREFLADMLALMDKSEPYRFSFASALASGVRDDEETLRSLVERVQGASGSSAVNPLLVLRAVGPRVAEFVPTIFPTLLGALDYPQSRFAATGALGAIGSQNAEWGERIALHLLELSHSNDEWLQGAAIEALGELQVRPDLVVPRLIEAFDDYEDPDPDNYYGSEHLRVTKALQVFGPLAAPAAPTLLRHLRDEEGQVDNGVLETLRAIGHAAGFEAWDRLDALAGEVAKEYEISTEELLDAEDSILGQAWRATYPF